MLVCGRKSVKGTIAYVSTLSGLFWPKLSQTLQCNSSKTSNFCFLQEALTELNLLSSGGWAVGKCVTKENPKSDLDQTQGLSIILLIHKVVLQLQQLLYGKNCKGQLLFAVLLLTLFIIIFAVDNVCIIFISHFLYILLEMTILVSTVHIL